MKSLAVITITGCLTISPAIAEDLINSNDQTMAENNNGNTKELAQDKQLAEQRAQRLNQNMELKLDEINGTIEQQIAIRFDFELND